MIAVPIALPRAARGVRPLVGGDDPAHLRRLHDHRHARDRLRRREHLGDPDLRDEPRAADRPRDRGRLLAAHRLPVPRGARGRQGDRRRGRADDADRRPGGRLLGDRRRARPGAARRDAAPVHPDARRRGLPDPDRLDRRRGHAPAGAPQLLRPPRHRAPPGAPPSRHPHPTRGFWARLARTIMARPILFLVAGTVRPRPDGRAGLLDPAHPRLDVRHPAHLAVGQRVRRAPAGGRLGRRRAVADPRPGARRGR